jgi:hypothetical protein
MGHYADNLAKRMRDKKKMKAALERFNVESAPARGDTHPNRYPKHPDANKGQVFNGECNRTACDTEGARYYNIGTFGLYCRSCAMAINRGHRNPLCVMVEAKPTIEEMQEMYRGHPF